MKSKNPIYLTIIIIIILFVAAFYFLIEQNPAQNIQNQTNTTISNLVNRTIGERQSNFLIQAINPANVTGLIYIEYPVAYLNGTNKTIQIGDTVGYACDGTLAKLVEIINNTIAVFQLNATKPPYGCPI
jgi:Na+/H+ antiporter NhaC